MSYVIDWCLNGKNKSMVNCQCFLRCYCEYIKKVVEEVVSWCFIIDMEYGEQISIFGCDIDELVLYYGCGGWQIVVYFGNKEFIVGEYIVCLFGGGGGCGGGKVSNSGEGMDDFVFQIIQEEFFDFMFEDLELFNLVKCYIIGIDIFKIVCVGISNDGNLLCINIVCILCLVYVWCIVLFGGSWVKLCVVLKELEWIKCEELDNFGDIQEFELEIVKFCVCIDWVLFFDIFDFKYNLLVKQFNFIFKVVMFCLMDVFGLMIQVIKDIVKCFFILFYLFFKWNYEKIEVVFICYYISVCEVDEEEFFYFCEIGGIIVFSVLKMMQEIMVECYLIYEWNIYVVQVLDGDNWNDDLLVCWDIFFKQIMLFVQYYIYVEIILCEYQVLWFEYECVCEVFEDSFVQQQIVLVLDIYLVFCELFQRRFVV